MLVRTRDQFVVALPALVGHAGQLRIPLLGKGTHLDGVVVRVGEDEVFRVVVRLDHDFTERVVHLGVGASFIHQVLKEGQETL